MFREMRRIRQKMSREEVKEIFERNTSGVLALLGDNDYPYALPISYVFTGNSIYFHCAREGHKIDAIKKSDKASFCVIDRDEIVPEKYTTYYRSAIAFGKIRVMEDEKEIRQAIEILAEKYSPNEGEASRREEIEKTWDRLCLLELKIEHSSGKQAIELVGE